MANDVALERAIADIKGIIPYAVASKSGTDYDGKRFKVPFFNRVFLVYYPEIKFVEEGKTAPVPQYIQIILLHYLLQARGVAIADEWIAYRQLPGGKLFDGRFFQMAITPLLRAFDNNVEGFKKAGLALGGIPITRTGDAAFKFIALPKIPMACIFYQGEEGIPSSVNILFDASASEYLPTEDLSLVGVYLVNAMRKAK
jgi:Domain of unknown function (DUF3786)